MAPSPTAPIQVQRTPAAGPPATVKRTGQQARQHPSVRGPISSQPATSADRDAPPADAPSLATTPTGLEAAATPRPDPLRPGQSPDESQAGASTSEFAETQAQESSATPEWESAPQPGLVTRVSAKPEWKSAPQTGVVTPVSAAGPTTKDIREVPEVRPRTGQAGSDTPITLAPVRPQAPQAAPLEISIGTIEIVAEPAPAAAPVIPDADGFADYRALRNYEDWQE